jgi:hypothetical protein
MSIFSSNDYKRGYEQGIDDAKSNKDKWNYSAGFSMGFSLKFALHGQKAMETFAKGYEVGYLDGLRVKNNIFQEEQPKQQNKNSNNSTLIKSATMQRGIDGQIDLLDQMKSFLEGMAESFESMIQTQDAFLRGLDSEGLDLKLLQRFEEYSQNNKSKIQDLIRNLESEDIPYTQQVIKYLEDTPR